MKTSYLKLSLLAFAILAAVACGKKKKDSNTAVNGGRDSRVTAGPSNLPTGQGSVPRQGTMITPADQNHEETVKVLASATVDPQYIGKIQYVDIAGQVSVNPQTGALNGGTASYIQVAIVDEHTGKEQDGQKVPPIMIRVANATGQAANWNANMTFSDEYGSITITGSYDQQNFRGTVRFSNTKGGYNNRKDGTLGSFVIPTCAFFVCN